MTDGPESSHDGAQQLALLRSVVREHPPPPATVGDRRPDVAPVDPVAEVLVETGLSHLDRPFDYLVLAEQHEAAQPGVRVKVRFAGRDLPGYVVARKAHADHDGTLSPLRRVVSPEVVLTPALLELATAVAARCAGSVGDVLRLAIPPRHARAEQALATEAPVQPELDGDRITWGESGPPAWRRYPAGAAFLRRVASGEAPRAVWNALPAATPDEDWPAALAQAAVVTHLGVARA